MESGYAHVIGLPPLGRAKVTPYMALLCILAKGGTGLAGGHVGLPGQVIAVIEGANYPGVPTGLPSSISKGTQEGH